MEDQRLAAQTVGEARDKEQAVQRMFSSIARYYDLNNSVLSLGLHHAWKRKAIRQLVSLLEKAPSGSPPHPSPLWPTHRNWRAMGIPGERDSAKLVLDVGSGTGDLALLAARRLGNGTRIIAADLNHPMLAVGLKKIRRKGLQQQILCVQANAQRICAQDGAFDAVTTGFCLRNVGDLPMVLAEIFRVLRPGGKLICLEFSRPVLAWLRRLYDWYSFTLLPWVGTRISGDTTGVYEYLPASIRTFPDQEGLASLMQKTGFSRVEYINLSGGIVAIHTASK